MPSFDYVGNAMNQTTYQGRDPYTGLIRSQNIPGRGSPTSTGPYDQSSPLGSAYQAEPFNLGQSGNLTHLTDLIDSINRSSQQQALQARIPNAPALEQQSSANIGSELRGELPQDVMNLLGQQAAERGVAIGSPGSPNANAAYLRGLGLTSLQQEQAGQQNLTSAYARNPAAPIFDPSSQLISPLNLAQIQEQGLGLNAQIAQDIARNNLAAQALQLRYANPSYNYGSPYTGTGGLTGSDVIPNDYSYSANTSGGSPAYSYSLPSDFTGNYYDFNPSYGFPSGNGYPSTPEVAYG